MLLDVHHGHYRTEGSVDTTQSGVLPYLINAIDMMELEDAEVKYRYRPAPVGGLSRSL